MKLAILADPHLGKRQYRTDDGVINRFEKAGYEAWHNSLDIIIKEKPDLLLLAGDIFDVPNPSVLALSEFRKGMDKVTHIPKLIILGNHDFHFAYRTLQCSSVQSALFERDNVLSFADYTVNYIDIKGTRFVLCPYVYDKQENLQAMWEECKNLAKENSILLTHGVTERYILDNPLVHDKFVIPEKILSLYEAVFIGHIHTPFEYRIKDTKTLVCSPGALIDYQADCNRTRVIFYDTETKEMSTVLTKTPHIVKLTCNEKNINTVLSKVEKNIYSLSYDGDTTKIDHDLYIEAKRQAIHLVLNLTREELVQNREGTVNEVHSFMDWIKEKYPTYVTTFKRLCSEGKS